MVGIGTGAAAEESWLSGGPTMVERVDGVVVGKGVVDCDGEI